MSSVFVDFLDFDDWQVQFVQRFEHAAQFRLVADRAPQFGVRRVRPPADNGDLHARQPVAPVLAQRALGDDPIEGRSAKIDIKVLCYTHSHVFPIVGFPGSLLQRHAGDRQGQREHESLAFHGAAVAGLPEVARIEKTPQLALGRERNGDFRAQAEIAGDVVAEELRTRRAGS